MVGCGYGVGGDFKFGFEGDQQARCHDLILSPLENQRHPLRLFLFVFGGFVVFGGLLQCLSLGHGSESAGISSHFTRRMVETETQQG